MIRPLTRADWSSVAEIYRQGIASGDATFETDVPTWEAWDSARHSAVRLVEEVDGAVVGFAAVSPVSTRAVYGGVAEVMVYVAKDTRGRGVGQRLLKALIEAAEASGIWTLQAGIFPENRPSIAIHERLGFRLVGVRKRLGRFHDGRWRDVVLMERRSKVVEG